MVLLLPSALRKVRLRYNIGQIGYHTLRILLAFEIAEIFVCRRLRAMLSQLRQSPSPQMARH